MPQRRKNFKYGNNKRPNKRDRDDADNDRPVRDSRDGRYQLTEKENKLFEAYYKEQGIVPEGEFDEFMDTLRAPLPATFRLTGTKSEAKELLKVVQGDYLQQLVNVEVDGVKLEPKCLPWYPDGLAWQLNLERKTIRNVEALQKLKTFLVNETESGNISRQEAVSMIPPLVLDVQPHHKILDMCAAPGSKTAQLVEFLHADEKETLPKGFVLANDSDNKRCYLMTHQLKRLSSPCFQIVNHDASQLPSMCLSPPGEKPKKWLTFDRVLADVPCSGDGTMRKNPDIWGKWNGAAGHSLHGLQTRILRRGVELLSVGGRLVYSTCSFNPIENEAVVAEMLRKCEGALKLVDVSSQLPGLKSVSGIQTWKVFHRKTEDWYTCFEDVPESLHSHITPSMFPPKGDEVDAFDLKKCMRLLPHHQNTGGFFIAVMEKVEQVPWFLRQKREQTGAKNPTENSEASTEKTEDKADAVSEMEPAAEGDSNAADNSRSDGPAPKKRRFFGFKEDPFIYMEETDTYFAPIREFFGINEEFPSGQIMVRCKDNPSRVRNIYFTSDYLKDIVKYNEEKIKFINMGVKLFSRSESKHTTCDYRLSQDGVQLLEPFAEKRRVTITKEDIVTILSQENPFLSTCSENIQTQLNPLPQGAVIFVYTPKDDSDGPQCKLVICGWKGKCSTRSFLQKNQRAHFLRLCGAELKPPVSKKADDKSGDAELKDEDENNDEAMEEVKTEKVPSEQSTEQTNSEAVKSNETDVTVKELETCDDPKT